MENVRITKIVKIGTSLGVVIPRTILSAYDLKRGDQVIFSFMAEDLLCICKLSDLKIKELRRTIPF